MPAMPFLEGKRNKSGSLDGMLVFAVEVRAFLKRSASNELEGN
jgi:hypothetical protein